MKDAAQLVPCHRCVLLWVTEHISAVQTEGMKRVDCGGFRATFLVSGAADSADVGYDKGVGKVG